MVELRLAVVLVAMLTLPGWAVLSFAELWRHWRGLQRWIVAVGTSIAFYPVLFYGLRFLAPFLTLGPYKMGALLLACAVIAGWRMRRHWRELFTFDWLEWVAIGIFGMTLFTRFWIIRDHPYPAWSDSLHHTLLTQLTAVGGKLPFDLKPYYPVPLRQYHLGLYSLSASVQWLAQAPAHAALLWVAQALNGLCGLGVYLVLDRKVGRLGAVVGAAVVGLLSHQPALYVNWGRFTQVSSQAILLIAWLVMWEAIVFWRRWWRERKAKVLWFTVVAAGLVGAVFLFHFRVAVFYLPLLMMSIVWELWQARKSQRMSLVILGTLAVGIATLVIIAPALWESVYVYVDSKLNPPEYVQTVAYTDQTQQMTQKFYEFPLSVVPLLVGRQWLMILAGLGAIIGLSRRKKLIVACLLWMVALYLVGKAYLLGISFLNITNLSGVLIMFYLPIGLIIGSGVEDVLALIGSRWRELGARIVVALVLGAGFVASHVRVTEIEPYRYFITPQDVVAMDWIKQNTPVNARFAVNTYFWLPGSPHGTDAGYWIPYFSGRQTTAGVMLNFLGTTEYLSKIITMSRAVEQLEVDNSSLAELQALGVDYVYIGRRGDFSGPGLNVAQLTQAQDVRLLYQNAGVSILQILPPE